MSESNHLYDELGAIGSNEGVEDSENTAEGESEDQSGDEKRQGGEFRDTIVDSHWAKLQLGKTTLEEIEGKHKWIADEIRTRQADKEKPAGVPDRLKEEILEELEVRNTTAQVHSIASKAQKELYDDTIEKYQEALGKREAMKLAVQVSGVDLSPQAANRRGLNLPQFGSADTESKPRVTESDRRMAKLMGVEPELVAKKRAEVEA